MKSLVLLVENDPLSTELVHYALGAGGHRVVSFSQAEEALRIAADMRPDLILMDIRLPGMDGVEATLALRSDPATAAIPVAALSAQAYPADVDRAREAGCVDYITKPIRASELLSRVDTLLGRHRRRHRSLSRQAPKAKVGQRSKR